MKWPRPLDWLGNTGKVRFARLRAGFWALLGLASVPLGWANSVALVWAASVYANVASEVASAEAADDSVVLAEIRELRAEVRNLAQLLAGVDERVPENGEHPAADETERDH